MNIWENVSCLRPGVAAGRACQDRQGAGAAVALATSSHKAQPASGEWGWPFYRLYCPLAHVLAPEDRLLVLPLRGEQRNQRGQALLARGGTAAAAAVVAAVAG